VVKKEVHPTGFAGLQPQPQARLLLVHDSLTVVIPYENRPANEVRINRFRGRRHLAVEKDQVILGDPSLPVGEFRSKFLKCLGNLDGW